MLHTCARPDNHRGIDQVRQYRLDPGWRHFPSPHLPIKAGAAAARCQVERSERTEAAAREKERERKGERERERDLALRKYRKATKFSSGGVRKIQRFSFYKKGGVVILSDRSFAIFLIFAGEFFVCFLLLLQPRLQTWSREDSSCWPSWRRAAVRTKNTCWWKLSDVTSRRRYTVC